LADGTTKVGSGATPKGGKAAYHSTGTPLIRSLNIHFDRFIYAGMAYLSPVQARELDNVTVRSGDVLLNITGASIGRVNQCPTELDGARVNQHVCIIRPVSALDAAFLRYFLSSPQQQGIIFEIETGVTRQALTKEMILNFEIPIPPLNEQRRIVAKIEELFSDLDAATAALERVRAKLKRYRAAVLKAAVEGKLTADWRARHPDTEPAAKLLERTLVNRRRKWEENQLARFAAARTPPKGWREKYTEPASLDTTRLPEQPQRWCWASMEQLITRSEYGTSVVTVHL
jgi:type I restriction enzyme S subunit